MNKESTIKHPLHTHTHTHILGYLNKKKKKKKGEMAFLQSNLDPSKI